MKHRSFITIAALALAAILPMSDRALAEAGRITGQLGGVAIAQRIAAEGNELSGLTVEHFTGRDFTELSFEMMAVSEADRGLEGVMMSLSFEARGAVTLADITSGMLADVYVMVVEHWPVGDAEPSSVWLAELGRGDNVAIDVLNLRAERQSLAGTFTSNRFCLHENIDNELMPVRRDGEFVCRSGSLNFTVASDGPAPDTPPDEPAETGVPEMVETPADVPDAPERETFASDPTKREEPPTPPEPPTADEPGRPLSDIARPIVWRFASRGDWEVSLEGEGTATILGPLVEATLQIDGEPVPILFNTIGGPTRDDVRNVLFSQTGKLMTAATGFGSGGRNYLTTSGRRVASLGEDGGMLLNDTGFARIDRKDGGLVIGFSVEVVSCQSVLQPPFRSVAPCDGSHLLSARPVGRALIEGWICARDIWEIDPAACEPPFQVDHVTPPPERENVNHVEPGLSVTFSEPIRLDTLDGAFSLHTYAPDGEPLTISGRWDQDGAARYAFTPEEPLYSGTLYIARIENGPDGVVTEDDGMLEEPFTWTFTTMLDLNAHAPNQAGAVPGSLSSVALGGPGEDRVPVRLHTFQVVRDGELTRDKPTLTRAYFTWDKHVEVDENMQPDRFRMEVSLSEQHPRWVGQHGSGRSGNSIYIWRHDDDNQFSDEDRRHARHTANFFGWRPGDSSGTLEMRLEPHDPFPSPLEDAQHLAQRDFEVWEEDPPQVTLHYAFARVGEWQEAVPDDMLRLARQGMAEMTRQVPSFFPHRRARALQQATMPPFDLDSIPDLLYDSDGNAVNERGERVQPRTRAPAAFHGRRIMEDIADQVAPTRDVACALLAEQFPPPPPLPDRTNLQVNALFNYMRDTFDTGNKLTDLLIDWFRLFRQAERLDAVFAPGDVIVLFVPQDFLSEFVAGLALGMAVHSQGVPNFGFPGMRVYLSVLGAVNDFDTFVQIHLHELGHEFGLEHVPGDAAARGLCPDTGDVAADALQGRNVDGIEAWRMAPGGLDGWNKSQEEGNAQADGTLVSMMWPWAMQQRYMSLADWEYRRLQRAVSEGTAAVLREGSAVPAGQAWRQYAELGERRTDAFAPNESLVLTGRIGGDGQGLEVHAVTRAVDAWPVPVEGRYTAELRDAGDAVLARATLDLLGPVDPTRTRAPDDPMSWQRFRVALPVDPASHTLVIRDGDKVRARMSAGPDRPEIQDAELSAGSDRMLNLEWVEAGDVMQTEIAYSPSGTAPWQVLAPEVPDGRFSIAGDMLMPGPAPAMRISARSGPRFVDQIIPLPEGAVMASVDVVLPPPGRFAEGRPLSISFGAPMPWPELEAGITATDASGQAAELTLVSDPEAQSLGIFLADPGATEAPVSLHFPEDMRDASGRQVDFPAASFRNLR